MNRRNFIQKTATIAAIGAVNPIARALDANSEPAVKPKRTLGKTGFEIFPVVYGGIVSMNDGQPASDHYVSWAVDHGINYFDVAPSYGDAQEKLGNSLKAHRDKIFLACKTGQRLADKAETEFTKSLELLHTDHFDVYQLHNLHQQSDLDQAFGPGGVMTLMTRLKQDGRVRKLGFSAHNEEIALKALALYDFDTVMFPLNWMMTRHNQMGVAISAEAGKRGMGILAIKPLTQRAWLNEDERKNSAYPKAWCKPIDSSTNHDLAISALKHTFNMGADLIIPHGDFKSFSFAVGNIREVLNNPLTAKDTALLDKEFELVKDHPFFT
jgi:aryl-alcohol dehydrogenase-like predicted oxidoreductase